MNDDKRLESLCDNVMDCMSQTVKRVVELSAEVYELRRRVYELEFEREQRREDNLA